MNLIGTLSDKAFLVRGGSGRDDRPLVEVQRLSIQGSFAEVSQAKVMRQASLFTQQNHTRQSIMRVER